MKKRFEDTEHLLRVVLLFGAGLAVFLLVQGLVVPKGFGAYGHYRAGALDDNASRALGHAGRAACGECHTEEAAKLKGGHHASLSCEGCHGPLAKHTEEGGKPPLPDPAVLCVRCHEKNAARPAKFPQVDAKAHADGARCTECHVPHDPMGDTEAAK